MEAMQEMSVSSKAVIRHVFWVDWLNKIPHVNLTLSQVNGTFDPFSPVYQESLGIIGSVPAAILILTLFVLLLYLLTRCCDTKPRKPGSIACLKATCVLTSILTLGTLGVSVWANEEVHGGVSESIFCMDKINSFIGTLYNKTKSFDETIMHNLQPDLNLFRGMVEKKNIQNITAQMILLENLHYMKGNISDILLINVEDIRTKVNRANLSNVVKGASAGEMIRWTVCLTITVLLMMIVLIVPIGVARHSRCALITFSVHGLKSLIICWALTSMYLVFTVGVSDWCLDPNPFLEQQLSRAVPSDVTTYYMRCEPTRPSPFTRFLTQAQQAAEVVESNLKKVTQIADDHYPQKDIHPRLDRLDAYVKQSKRILGSIAGLLECQDIHQEYLSMLSITCNKTISGFVYLLCSAAGSGVLFTLLVWFTSHTWIYLNNKGEPIATYNERERFIPDRNQRVPTMNMVPGTAGHPRPRHSHTPPQTPPFPGTLNGRIFHSDGMTVMNPIPNNHPRMTGSSTMPRPHSNNHNHSHQPVGPNQGQYATLSKQCKTLESSDFY